MQPSANTARIERRGFVTRCLVLASALGAPRLLQACEPLPETSLLPDERVNSWNEITTYNNFYEFSPDKDAVRHLAKQLRQYPWKVMIDGEVFNPGEWPVEDMIARFSPSERIFRMRCVEGWSRVVPWTGFSLCRLLALARPTPDARYVKFTALNDPAQMPGQRRNTFDWPYVEALTLDEAMHPLTSLVTGLHGKPLPPQNGGPLRLVVPWKYGYKSIKCIVQISLTRERPATTWTTRSPEEYSFSGNVNPEQPHPRWSQSRELRIGEMRKRRTLPFNGYADAVTGLYPAPT